MRPDPYPQFAGRHAHARAAAIIGHEQARLFAEQLRRDQTGERRRMFLAREGADALTVAGVALEPWRRMGFTIEGEQG